VITAASGGGRGGGGGKDHFNPVPGKIAREEGALFCKKPSPMWAVLGHMAFGAYWAPYGLLGLGLAMNICICIQLVAMCIVLEKNNK
jgi:hypothetical protein